MIVVAGGESHSAIGKKDIFFSGGMLNLLDSPVAPPQPLVDAVVQSSLTDSGGSIF